MRTAQIATMALALQVAAPCLLRGQELPSLGAGAHVRITAPTAFKGTLEGYVKAVRNDSIDLQSENHATVSVPKAAITNLEVAFGNRGHARQGALIGAGIGLLPGIVTCSGESSESAPG